MKEGGPLPAFRPSEVPSDYVACPYCRRNFNEHAAKRHIPLYAQKENSHFILYSYFFLSSQFSCQTQQQRKQGPPPRPNQQFDRVESKFNEFIDFSLSCRDVHFHHNIHRHISNNHLVQACILIHTTFITMAINIVILLR